MWDIGFNGGGLEWKRSLWLEELLLLLHGVKAKPHEENRFVWWKHKDGFSLKDGYKRIYESYFLVLTLDPLKIKVLDCLWKSKVPIKILIFGWILILNKLHTRMELAKRGIIYGSHNVVCPLCFMEEEDLEHFFCSFSFS